VQAVAGDVPHPPAQRRSRSVKSTAAKDCHSPHSRSRTAAALRCARKITEASTGGSTAGQHRRCGNGTGHACPRNRPVPTQQSRPRTQLYGASSAGLRRQPSKLFSQTDNA
jgi:hypothetical protein